MPGEFLGTDGGAEQFEGGAAANDEAATSEAPIDTSGQVAEAETDPFADLEANGPRKRPVSTLAVAATALTLAPVLFGFGGGRLESSGSDKPDKPILLWTRR